MSTLRLQLKIVLGVVLAVAGLSVATDTTPSPSDSAVDSALLESISSQAPVITDATEFYEAITLAQAMQVWRQQDSVLGSWPRYLDVREILRQDLSLTIDLQNVAVAQLCEMAAGLRADFWREEGALSADGYRKPYQARVLLEVAHDREPANLAVSDELVETILTSHPLEYFDPETKDCVQNREVILDLRALRSGNYTQVRMEIEQGRSFTWEDFARVADFVELWSAQDPRMAEEAFEWGLAQVGPSLSGSDYEKYSERVLTAIRNGGGVGFAIYMRLLATYPHDYLYARRLPSFRGPDLEGNGLAPMLGIGSPAEISFGS